MWTAESRRSSCDGQLRHARDQVQSWLARHPRYHVHFTPTSANWLNLIELLFAEVTERCVRGGSHMAVRTLEAAMLDYLDKRNQNPKPFVWTAGADLILVPESLPLFTRHTAAKLDE